MPAPKPRTLSRIAPFATALLVCLIWVACGPGDDPSSQPSGPSDAAESASAGAAPAPNASPAGENAGSTAALADIPTPRFDDPAVDIAEDIEREIRAGLEEVERQRAEGRPDAASYGDLGKLLQVHGLPEAARVAYQNASALDTEDPRWPYYLAVLAADAGDAESAEGLYGRVLELAPDALWARLRLADALYEARRAADAQRAYERALEQGEHAYAYRGLGRLAADRGDHRQAANRFERALELQPGATRLHYPLAQSYRQLGDVVSADRNLALFGPVVVGFEDPWMRDLERRRAGLTGILRRAGQALIDQRFEESAAAFREAIALDPADSAAQLGLASALAAVDADAAIDALRAALEPLPDDASIHLALGAQLLRQERSAAAQASLRRATQLDPGLLDAQLLLGQALFAAEQWSDAASRYRSALEIDGTNHLARLYLGVAEAEAGRLDAAAEELGLVFERMPEDPWARGELARVEVRRAERAQRAGEWTAAIAGAERALELLEGDADARHVLARLLATAPPELRDGDRATELATLAFETLPSPYYAEALAMAHAAAGRFGDAIAWQEALLAEAGRSQDPYLVERLERNLGRYRDEQVAIDAPTAPPPG